MQIQTEITLTPIQEKQIALKWFKKVLQETPDESIQIANADDKKILNIKEAAEFLHIGEQRLRKFCIAGLAPFFKNKNAYAFYKDELWDWFKTKPQLPLTDKEKQKAEHQESLLGMQWVLVEDIQYHRKGERKLRMNQVVFVFKTGWEHPKIIKKTVSEDYKFIITDTIRNLNLTSSGLLYDDFMQLRTLLIGKQVKLEVTRSNSFKFPYNCGTPLEMKHNDWLDI